MLVMILIGVVLLSMKMKMLLEWVEERCKIIEGNG